MAFFRCNRCKRVYEDYYPPDDSCIKCKRGTVTIVTSGRYMLSTNNVDNPVSQRFQDICNLPEADL